MEENARGLLGTECRRREDVRERGRELHRVTLLARVPRGGDDDHTAVELPAELPLRGCARGRLAPPVRLLPVVDRDGAVVGLLPMARATASHGATAGEAAVRDEDLLLGPDEPVAALLERTAFLQVGRAIVVDAARRPLGVVSATDIERRVRTQRITGATPRNTSARRSAKLTATRFVIPAEDGARAPACRDSGGIYADAAGIFHGLVAGVCGRRSSARGRHYHGEWHRPMAATSTAYPSLTAAAMDTRSGGSDSRTRRSRDERSLAGFRQPRRIELVHSYDTELLLPPC